MDLVEFFVFSFVGLVYAACGALLAAAFGIATWSVTWFACVLAWPVAGFAIFVIVAAIMEIFALLMLAITAMRM